MCFKARSLPNTQAEESMEILLLAGHHAQAEPLCERKQLCELHDALGNYREVTRKGAHALRLVADGRDAFVYYRVGEDLGLRWDFSDPETTCEASWRLEHLASVLCRPPLFGSVACASRVLARDLELNNKLEQAMLWLDDLSGPHAEDLRICADLLDAAAAVVDYQLQAGISMEVAALCVDGSGLRAIASGLRDFVDTIVSAIALSSVTGHTDAATS